MYIVHINWEKEQVIIKHIHLKVEVGITKAWKRQGSSLDMNNNSRRVARFPKVSDFIRL